MREAVGQEAAGAGPLRRSGAATAPLLAPAIGLMAGIVLQERLEVPPALQAAVAVVAGAWMVLRRRSVRVRRVALGFAAGACGMALFAADQQVVTRDHVVHYAGETPVRVRMRGTVVAAPTISRSPQGFFYSWSADQFRSRLLLESREILTADGWRPMSGLVSVSVGEAVLHVGAGQVVELSGRLARPRPPSNPGETDWRRVAARQGVYAQMTCSSAESVRVLPDAASARGRRALAWLRTRARQLLLPEARSLEDRGDGLPASVVLGERSRVGRELNQLFAATGTSHFLSVSGLHVGMLAAFVWFVAAVVGLGRKGRAACAIPAVVLYALIAEPRAPILRAAVLAVLGSCALLAGRPLNTLNWMAAAALVVLVARPAELFMPGFQLSFIVVMGIIYVTPLLREAVVEPLLRRRRYLQGLRASPPRTHWAAKIAARGVNAFGWSLLIAVTAWLVGTPVVALHFGMFSTWGWVNSLIVAVPAFVLMMVGFARVLLAMVVPTLGALLGPALAWSAAWMERTVTWLAEWPAAVLSVPPPPLWLVVAFYGALTYAVVLARLPRAARAAQPLPAARRAHRARLIRWQLNCGAATAVLLLLLLLPAPKATSGLTVDVLAVGSGSATLIRTPSGRTILYDAGTLSGFDAGRGAVLPALLAERVRRLEAAIVSHPNTDHYNALPTVLAGVPSARFATSSHFAALAGERSSAARMLGWLDTQEMERLELHRGDSVEVGDGVRLEVLWPPRVGQGPRLSTNDASLVVRLTYGGQSMLLCGDIEAGPQSHLLEHDRERLRSDVLVLPHHGSVEATTAAFVEAVAPQWVIRSSGEAMNRTGRALREIVRGYSYLSTADDGAIRVELHKDGIICRAWHPAARSARRS